MINDNDSIKAISLENNDFENIPEFVQIDNIKNEIINKDSNFVFFFGVSASGKSVILSLMLYYLNSKAGVLKPQKIPKEANVLLIDFYDKLSRGILPDRTTRDKVTRLDFVFEPNSKSKKIKPINLTFLETAGGNHTDISIKKGGKYHASIDAYLQADIPLNFIIVTSYDKGQQDDSLIIQFFDELEKSGRNLKQLNLILVISKWDKSGKLKVTSEEELNNFISERLPMTNNRINTFELSKTYFTVGEVKSNDDTEKITLLNLGTAEILSNWLYESIVGYPLNYQGTFWERLKFDF